jgi:hypothetical protein
MLTDYCSPCQSTIILNRPDLFKSNRRQLIVRYKRNDEYVQTMKGVSFTLNNDSNSEEKTKKFVLETTNASTVSTHKPNILHKLTKVLIIVIVVVGSVLFISISIGLTIIYIKCNRPSRIQRDLPVEYLNSTELINYLEETSSIDAQTIVSINSFTSSQHSNR